MTDQPEQLMSQGREVSMTVAEQTAMRSKLLAYTASYRSPKTTATSAWSWARQHAVMTLALLAVLVLGGTGVSAHYASPNDAFYGFRLSVNDRIEGALAFSEDAQFDVELRQIQRQLDAEDRAFDEALTDDEQDEDSGDDEKSVENRKDEKESDDDNDTLEGDLELEAELRQMERELQLEASVSIELEN